MDAIAVVGLGCVLPNALRVSDFWASISTGKVSLTKVPARAWDHSLYFHPDRTMQDRAHAELGGFINDFVFDWRKYKVTPADAQQVNPFQWMVLEAGTQALSAVRVLPRDTTGIILGATSLGWQRDSGMHIRLEDMLDAVRATDEFRALPTTRQQEVLEVTAQRLRARLKECSDDNVVGSSASVAAGRINMQFDLKGLHYSVDAGYSSSLAALDLAVRGLRDGEFDLAVAGGVSEMLTPLEFIAFSKLGGLSHKGHVKPFSDECDGTLLGEGVSLFALKRLEDAERDGETIYAVLRGVGGSSDGRGKSLVAPRREGQAMAMRRAVEDAGVELDSIQYVECHATGTPVGDVSEVQALASVYTGAAGSIALGSVKANIGHLRAGAGGAGLLKAVLALHHGQIPPQPGVERVNPKLELERTPFYIPRMAQPFRAGTLPRAAVSSFSFGGNNFHAVLEAWRPGSERRPAPRRRQDEPLAIVGMGGMFPGAANVETLWKRLLEGHDATREVPRDRWKVERYHHADRKDRTYTKLGCWLDELPSPTMEMRIPPAAWASLDPSHVVTLLSTEQALKDAGYSPDKWDRDRVALALGFLPYQGIKFLADSRVRWAEFAKELRETLEKSGLPDELRGAILRNAEERYKAGLPPISEDSLTGYLGCLNAGRVASLYDFHGPHMVMDSACASSLAALHASWKLLQHREADVVLTGGVWADMSPEFFIAGCRFNALSAKGSTPFNAQADGFVPGEGAGILVLKRLSDAERDKDRIHSVIRSVAGSSDGKGRSVLPPSEMGETLAMRRALAAANVPPTSVDYVECHGTGTALGDVVETKSTHNAYSEGRTRPILIGSVKSNIGHLNAAAGAAGMIKVTRAMQERLIPRSLKSEPRNPKIPQGVDVVTDNRDWPAPPGGAPRRAGVSGFGVGGSNFHAILEEYKGPPSRPEKKEGEPAEGDPKLVAVAGTDARACMEQLNALCEQQGPLEDTRRTSGGPWRVAITARTREELRKKRDFLRKTLEAGGDTEPLGQSGIFAAGPDAPLRGAKVAITFPGQGGQYANMLRPLARAYPVVARTLEEADRVYLRLTGRTLTSSFYTEDAKNYRQNDEDIHAAVFLVNVALYRLLVAHGIHADMVIGQSAGELAALVTAGSLTLEEGLRAIHSRTVAVLEMPTEDPGQMAALACPSEQVPELIQGLPGYATLAADNGPRACIVSADRNALPGLVERCTDRGIECTVLAVSHGYHSELIGAARPAYQRVLQGLSFRAPAVRLISTIDAADYGDRPLREYPAFLTSQFVEPVRLRQAIGEAHRQGARIFIEAGPKWSLTQFTREILKGKQHGAIASIHPKVGDMEQFKRVVGYSFVNGVGQLSEDATTAVAEVEQALLQLPLEGVLEPASALKVAIALGREFGVDASVAQPENLRTFEAIVALVEQLRTGQAAVASAPPAAKAPPAEPAPAAHAVTTVQKSIALEEEVRRVLLDTVVTKTGYPEDMLEMDLDLEADLGIDTVKQVDIFARTREHFGVSRDPNRALRDFNTLRKVIDHIVERVLTVGGAATQAPAPAPAAARPAPAAPPPAAPAPVAPPAPAAPVMPTSTIAASLDLFEQVREVLLRTVVEKTGYPEDMLEMDLDLEADLGIDTVKQVDIFARTREAFGVSRDPNRALRDFNTLRKVIDHIVERAQSMGAPAAAASHARAAAPAPVVEEPAKRSGGGGPRSVRDALLALDLRQAGVKDGELRKLGEAMSSRVGTAAPETESVRTLSELAQKIVKGR
ncbi:type I polyketide synthase [Archangium lansingense]|uniref:Beta-ketoacyl synthase N-terminal-like domain-containing protein n=1 Tax=Archangium lansingense TaxID=2995310 RepID=A0ABT3ZZR1_9BACT|nr:type I polyketide synthase [Archangium lansinium]MCY1074897.1 beta-ketoacyl synthase N-terminal-like domain-containing protein [Archangium lansinium]